MKKNKFKQTKRPKFWEEVPDSDWNNWKWQYKNRITKLETLRKIIKLTSSEINAFQKTKDIFRFGISPHYASLIGDSNDPIRLQAIPQEQELELNSLESGDPLNERKYMLEPSIIHKYPDRLLLYVTNDCVHYCRHCTRKEKDPTLYKTPTRSQVQKGIRYIKKHKEIRDVVISGGDPLSLSSKRLEDILKQVSQIDHVEIIRIGTRNLVTLPQRINNSLVEVFKKYSPLYINTQFNHPKECTREAYEAAEKLRAAGCILGNQTILLNGVNDNEKTIKEINHKLLMMGIRPYYLYLCDRAKGNSHFRTTLSEGLEIIKSLDGLTSGLAIPHFIKDTKIGKVSLCSPGAVQKTRGGYLLRNYKGEVFEAD